MFKYLLIGLASLFTFSQNNIKQPLTEIREVPIQEKIANDSEKDDNKKTQDVEVDKKTVISIILVIAASGMTFICVFYILKNKNIIK